MTEPSRSDLDCETYHAILAVSDVPMAVDFYVDRLGFWLAFAEGTPPTFAGERDRLTPTLNWNQIRAWLNESARSHRILHSSPADARPLDDDSDNGQPAPVRWRTMSAAKTTLPLRMLD